MMQTKKAYIAGPVRGKANLNKDTFKLAADDLRRRGWEVFSPGEHIDNALPCRDIMRTCLNEVMGSDAVFVLPAWENSRGARIEVEVARRMGIPVLYAFTDEEPVVTAGFLERVCGDEFGEGY